MKVYRSYESKYPNYGSNSDGLWVAEDFDYCKDAIINGDTIVCFTIMDNTTYPADADDLSDFLIDEEGNRIDDVDDCVEIILNCYNDPFYMNQIKRQGYNSLFYDGLDEGYLWFIMDEKILTNPQIVFKRGKKTESCLKKKINVNENQFKRLILGEEVVADGSSDSNPYDKKWKHQKDILKNYIVQNGVLMQSMENGKIYKVLYDLDLSRYLGVEYAYCIQYDQMTMKPLGTVYLRALDTFTYNIRNVGFDTRGRDNKEGTADDLV